MILTALIPLAKGLIDEYMEEGEIDKSTLKQSLAAAVESIKDADHNDVRFLGQDIEAFGKCLQAVAGNHKPSDGNIPPLDETGGGLTHTNY